MYLSLTCCSGLLTSSNVPTFPFVCLMCVCVLSLHTRPGIEFSHRCSVLHTFPHGYPVLSLYLGTQGLWGPQPGSVYPAVPSTMWPPQSSGISCVCCRAATTAALVSSYLYVYLLVCVTHVNITIL